MFSLYSNSGKNIGDVQRNLLVAGERIRRDIALHLGAAISGQQLRISSAVVIMRLPDHHMYLYCRTGEGATRRGLAGTWDTPIGRVAWVDEPKWCVPNERVTGFCMTHYACAHEYNAEGKYAEFVLMPTFVFVPDEKGCAVLDQYANQVPGDMGDVAGYEWVAPEAVTSTNASTKVLAAREYARRK